MINFAGQQLRFNTIQIYYKWNDLSNSTKRQYGTILSEKFSVRIVD